MNRRDFIKASAALSVAPSVLASAPVPTPSKEHFTVDCFMYDKEVKTKRRFAMNNEYHHGF